LLEEGTSPLRPAVFPVYASPVLLANFGKVVKGQDIVDKIGSVKVGADNKPVEDVTIISISKQKKEKK
jgi:cyclophilin family peptidyl-prolyl cis-trans isomerase